MLNSENTYSVTFNLITSTYNSHPKIAHSCSLKAESNHDANFVFTGGITLSWRQPLVLPVTTKLAS